MPPPGPLCHACLICSHTRSPAACGGATCACTLPHCTMPVWLRVLCIGQCARVLAPAVTACACLRTAQGDRGVRQPGPGADLQQHPARACVAQGARGVTPSFMQWHGVCAASHWTGAGRQAKNRLLRSAVLSADARPPRAAGPHARPAGHLAAGQGGGGQRGGCGRGGGKEGALSEGHSEGCGLQ